MTPERSYYQVFEKLIEAGCTLTSITYAGDEKTSVHVDWATRNTSSGQDRCQGLKNRICQLIINYY